MTSIASTVQTFFTERLIAQRRSSPATIRAYRDTVRMLLTYAAEQTRTPCHRLEFGDLNATTVSAFLDHLERDRRNSVRTRNARLAAIHSLFAFAALHHPEHAADIQRVLAIPAKRGDRTIITHLTDIEIQALLGAPNRATRTGVDLSDPRRCPPRRRSPHQLPWQGTQGPHHPLERDQHRCPARLDERTTGRPVQSAFHHQPRRTTQPRRSRPTSRNPRRRRV